MITAGVLDSQDQITKGELSKIADAISGLIGELPSDKQVINKAVSMSTKMGISIFQDVSGKNTTAWNASDIEAWVQSRIVASQKVGGDQ